MVACGNLQGLYTIIFLLCDFFTDEKNELVINVFPVVFSLVFLDLLTVSLNVLFTIYLF